MHHICNFVRFCFNNNKNTTSKKHKKNIKNILKAQEHVFLNFNKKTKKRFLHHSMLSPSLPLKRRSVGSLSPSRKRVFRIQIANPDSLMARFVCLWYCE